MALAPPPLHTLLRLVKPLSVESAGSYCFTVLVLDFKLLLVFTVSVLDVNSQGLVYFYRNLSFCFENVI